MILRRWVYYNICGKYLCVDTYLSLLSMFWSCYFPQDRGGGREKRLRMGKWKVSETSKGLQALSDLADRLHHFCAAYHSYSVRLFKKCFKSFNCQNITACMTLQLTIGCRAENLLSSQGKEFVDCSFWTQPGFYTSYIVYFFVIKHTHLFCNHIKDDRYVFSVIVGNLSMEIYWYNPHLI